MAKPTSLSVGLAIRDALKNSTAGEMATDIFPVVTAEAKLPYIVYRCESSSQVATKSGMVGSDTVRVAVDCYAETYLKAVQLAEEVRLALDCKQPFVDELTVRSCLMSDSSDAWTDDAFVKELIFTVKV